MGGYHSSICLTRNFAISPKLILVASIAVKLILAPFFAHPSDMKLYGVTFFAFHYLEIDPTIYLSQYGPGTSWMFGLSTILGILAGASPLRSPLYFNFIIKLPLICADTIAGYVIFRKTRSALRTTLWAFSPISFYAIVLNAHPSIYFATSVLIGVILLKKTEFNASAVWFGLAAVFQYVGLLLAPLIMMELKRLAPKNTIKICSAYFVGSALVVSLPLLLASYGGDWFVHSLIEPTGPVSFAISGRIDYRGANLNLLEYLKFDLGIGTPPFLYTASAILAVILLIYLTARARLSAELWIIVVLDGIFLVYPQLHLQHLLFILPIVLISELRARVTFLYNLISVPVFLSWDNTAFLDETIRNTLGLPVSYDPNLNAVRCTYFVTTALLIYVLVEIYKARTKNIHTFERHRHRSLNLKIGIRCISACLLLIVLIGACSAQLFAEQGVLDQSRIKMGKLVEPGTDVTESYAWTISNIDARYFRGSVSNVTTFAFDLKAKEILISPFQVYFNSWPIINSTQLAGAEGARWRPEDDGARTGKVEDQAGKTIFTKTFGQEADVASWTLDIGSIGTPVKSIVLVLGSSPDAVVEIALLRDQTPQYTELIVNKTWSAHAYSLVSDGTTVHIGNDTQMYLQGKLMPIDQLMIRIKTSRSFPTTERVRIDSLIATNAFLPRYDEVVAIVPPRLIETQSRVVLKTASMNVGSASLTIMLDATTLKPVPILQNGEVLLLLLSVSAEILVLVSSHRTFTSEALRLLRRSEVTRGQKTKHEN